MNSIIRLSIFLSVLLSSFTSPLFSCECPAFPPLSKALFETANKRMVVFKGKVLSTGPCKEIGSCLFEVQQLFAGEATQQLNAVYDCSSSCMMNFAAGEEWIIYAEYVQPEKIEVSFCSRSRKIDPANSPEIEQLAYGIGSADELVWLKENIGEKPIKPNNTNRQLGHKNEKPAPMQQIILLVVSIAALLLFMVGIKRFLK